MKLARYAIPLLVILALLITLVPACAQPTASPSPAASPKPSASPSPSATPSATPAAQKKITWDISLFGSPRALTYPIEDFAKDMNKATNGLWEIKLHYGEVLAPSKDALDGLKSGLFQAALWCPMYNPGKTPLSTVEELAFISPGTVPQIGQWLWDIGKQPAIVKELEAWNAQLLFPCPLPQYQFMGKKPIKTTDDFKGLRVRASAEMGRPLEKYGASIVMVTAPEVYSALEKGIVDTAFFVWTYTFGSYKLYELSKYATIGVNGGITGMQVAVSKTAFAALPKEWQDLATKWSAASTPLFDKYNAVDDAKWIPIFEKAGIEISTFPAAEKAKLLEQADGLWAAWAKKMDDQKLAGTEILNFAKADRIKVEKEVK